MRIGELADAVGVSTSTIRYYEMIGLLERASRASSGYRDYSDEDVRRVRFLAHARMLGIPLAEVRQIAGLAFEGRCDPLRGELSSALERRLADTRRRIRELRALQRDLERMRAQLAEEGCASERTVGSEAGNCACLDGLTTSHSAERESRRIDDRKEESR